MLSVLCLNNLGSNLLNQEARAQVEKQVRKAPRVPRASLTDNRQHQTAVGTACSWTWSHGHTFPNPSHSTALLIWELSKDKWRDLGSWKEFQCWTLKNRYFSSETANSTQSKSTLWLKSCCYKYWLRAREPKSRPVSSVSVALFFNTHMGTKRFFISNLVMLLKIRKLKKNF